MANITPESEGTNEIVPADFLSEFDDDEQLAEKLNKSPRTIARWRRLRIGPATTYIGNKPYTAHRATRQWLAKRERKAA